MDWILYGSRLSPFAQKTRLLCEMAGLTPRWLPEDGGRVENVALEAKVFAFRRGWQAPDFPVLTDLDDRLPLVPYLFTPEEEVLWDSTAIGNWLHDRADLDPRFLPSDPLLRFFTQLVDEAIDEWGLYLLHHQRWVVSAKNTKVIETLMREYQFVIPKALRKNRIEQFVSRQVERLPYLFSFAPEGFEIAGLPEHRQPYWLEDFPETHSLLEDSFSRLIKALDAVFEKRPFLFGNRLTMGDASVYGMFSSLILVDPETEQNLQRDAPNLVRWVNDLSIGKKKRDKTGPLSFDPVLIPLIEEIKRTFLSLMQQNDAAYDEHRKANTPYFNEAAFRVYEALYDGEIDGHAFRTVVKSFQVKVWRGLRQTWVGLEPADHDRIRDYIPDFSFLSR